MQASLDSLKVLICIFVCLNLLMFLYLCVLEGHFLNVYFGLSLLGCSFYFPNVWLSLFVHFRERFPALVHIGRWRGVPRKFFSFCFPSRPACVEGRASCGSEEGRAVCGSQAP